MDRIYRFLNNDLSLYQSEMNYYCGTLVDFGEVEETLVAYNPIPSKLETLKGDLLNRGANFRVMLLTAKAVRDKNDELLAYTQASVNEELTLALKREQARLEGMDEQELNEHIESLRTRLQPKDINRLDFLSKGERIYSRLLQFAYYDQDVQSKRLETLEDGIGVSRLFSYIGWRYGKPYIEVLNPKYVGFDKNPNERFVEKGDYAYYLSELTVADALQEYQNKIRSKKQLDKMIGYASAGWNSAGNVGYNPLGPTFDYTQFYSVLSAMGESYGIDTGKFHGNQADSAFNWHNVIPRTHLELKAFSRKILLTIYDEYGHPLTFTLDDRADVIPSYATKTRVTLDHLDAQYQYEWTDAGGTRMLARVVWIPRAYEMTSLGEDLFIDYRPTPHQPDHGYHVFERFELSYKGGIFFNRNAEWISLVQRAMPTAFQAMAVKRIQDREIAFYVGQERAIDTSQIDPEVGMDHLGNERAGEDALLRSDIIAKRTKTRPFNGARLDQRMQTPATRSAGVIYNVVDTSPQLLALQQLYQQLDIECGMKMGIPPGREGAVAPNTTATDNRQSLIQSMLSTQTLFYTLDMHWSRWLNAYLVQLTALIRMHFEDNPESQSYELEYVLPDGAKEFFAIMRDDLSSIEDLGLYLFDNGKEQLYFNTMMQMVFSFAQNAGEGVAEVSAVVKALTSTNSVEEMHESISQAAEKQAQRTQAQLQQQQQIQQQMQKMATELEEYRANLKLQGDLAKIREQGKQTLLAAEIQSQTLANQFDIDKDNQNDLLEQSREDHAFEAAENAKDRAHEKDLARIKASASKGK